MNFDAKIRRQSIEPDDLLHAHIGSMDAVAEALLNAATIVEDGAFILGDTPGLGITVDENAINGFTRPDARAAEGPHIRPEHAGRRLLPG